MISKAGMFRASCRVACLGVLVLMLGGLTGCGYVAEMTGRLFTKPAKTTPVYTFGTNKVLVLVDVSDPGVERELPRLSYDLAQAIIVELETMQATGGMVSPRVVAYYRQSTANYRLLTVPQVDRKSVV